ncbi:D-2-hydroxyacid dehydrogenase [Streptomyces sp. NBC_01795]|uniref:NAD(P)-dependent oxidoreductase n=1 Tax=Streptomyces sp. NBC_01795 TaxID=2975943 RepID=UPI002DD8050E|nr:NAD(P)-dependent oxidoreductase [Streptomyces sp. NBC_01795]WSA90949.1 D-2-hydroxyacid dehydrogenase [Streptomyces sp. NBC_01795]
MSTRRGARRRADASGPPDADAGTEALPGAGREAVTAADARHVGGELGRAVVTADPALSDEVVRGLAEVTGRPLGTGDGARVHIGPGLPELAEGERLLWMHSTWAGVDGLLGSRSPWPREVLLTRTVGRMGERIGQYVLGWALADCQNIAGFLRQHQGRVWHRLPTESAEGTTAVIFGTGAVGAAVAAALQCCGMSTVGVARSTRTRPGFDRVIAMDSMGETGGAGGMGGMKAADAPEDGAAADGEAADDGPVAEALARARFVINALPLTPATTGLFGPRLFAAMEGALFMNVGRGESVDTVALGEALRADRLRGAVLDVLPDEPVPATSELWDLPRTVLTSHSAGVTTDEDVLTDFRAAWRSLSQGEPPALAVDPGAGY